MLGPMLIRKPLYRILKNAAKKLRVIFCTEKRLASEIKGSLYVAIDLVKKKIAA